MKRQKKYYYVAVVGEGNQFRFVTKIEEHPYKVAEWEATGIPYKFYSWEDADYVALGLTFHGTTAFPVVLTYELKEPLFREVKEAV